VQIEELVKSLDTRTPQVLIESRIVQATLDFTRELGVQWGFNYRASAATGNPTGATFPSNIGVGGVVPGNPGPFGSIGDNFLIDLPAAVGQGSGGALGIVLGSITGAYDLDIRLSALENRGDGRILSSPKVLTLDNQAARIEQGVSIPFLSVSAAGTQTQFVDATLRLEVTPQVTNDGRVLMNIRVTDNAPDPSIVGANGQPAIRRNEAETQVLSIDGETIVIGGIFTRTSTENLTGIPWFSRIPLLGFLFRNTQTVDQRRELLVFITPRIIR
jgi:type IV pilus assembly protein PilQ